MRKPTDRLRQPCFPVAVLLAAACASLAVGCGKAIKNEVVPVTGKIVFSNGKTLPEGTVLLFNPSEGEVGSASGKTATDGAFEVVHVSGKQGAETGKYTVLLRAPEGMGAEFYDSVPKDYYEGGVLVAEVSPGMAPLDFTIQQ